MREGGRKRGKVGGRRERASVHLFFPEMTATAGAGPGLSQEPVWVAAVQLPWPSSAAFLLALARGLVGSGAARTRNGTHMGCQCHRQQPIYVITLAPYKRIQHSFLCCHCFNAICCWVLLISCIALVQIFKKKMFKSVIYKS